MRKLFFLSLLLVTSAFKFPIDLRAPLLLNPVTVDLKNPRYKEGIVTTKEGGVIRSKDFYLQAEEIEYTHTKENHLVKATGSILIQFRGKAYTGQSFQFDFDQMRGTVRDGSAYLNPFYVGGDVITLEPDGTYHIEEARLTTSENKDSFWSLRAKRASVKKKELFSAENVSFRFLKIPFWLPSFNLNLDKPYKKIIQYGFTWDKSAGPRGQVRFRIFSWRDLAIFVRGEYRLRKGFGGAFETEYLPKDKNSSLITRSYLAKDRLPSDPTIKRRYRLQGEGHSTSPSGKTKACISWDKYSDVLMPNDFKSQDFEVNAARKNEFFVQHHEDLLKAYFKVRPKVNSFQSLQEELPTAYVSLHPYRIPVLGIITEANAKAAYQRQSYSTKLQTSLQDFQSARLEIDSRLYRSICLSHLSITPKIGVLGTYYNESPLEKPITYALLQYGGSLETNFYRCYSKGKHIITPYAEYYGFSKPTSNINDHYIFSLQDGMGRIDQLKWGVKNALFTSNSIFRADLYTNAFLFKRTFSPSMPKLYLDLEWEYPSFYLKVWSAYNIQHHLLDYSNALFKVTVNENAAFSLEVRYRSKYDWRKANHKNFVLDVTRSEEELLSSPISDQRMTVLSHFFFRLTPFWTLNIKTHHGYLRKGEPPYNEIRADLYTLIDQNYRLRLTYQHTQRDDRFTAGFELMKK